MQRYMYANANPGRYWDPDGHLADELASGTSMSWGEYSAVDGGSSNAGYQTLQTETTVGADVVGQRRALTAQVNSGAREVLTVASKEIRGLDWNRALGSFLEGVAVGVGIGVLIAAIPVMICAGPVFAVLAVAGAVVLGGMAIHGLITGGARAYDDYQNAVASGSDHPVLRTMAVTLGRSTGLTEDYEAISGHDAITGRSLSMEERNDRLAEGAASAGGELGAGVGALAVRRTLGTGFCFVAGTLVAMTSTAYAQPIEDVRVGDRVEVRAEQESTCSHEAREDQVRVSFVFANERASWDTVYLDKLVSRAEAESLGFEVGASVWVDGTDFGAAGWAQVSAVEPVHVEAGAGCVVYATVEHQNGELVRLDLSDGSEVLGTAGHRYWSVTRGGWFEARELREGEALRTPSGVVHVTSSEVIDALAPVFNIEVEGAHEYFVGEGEVLVHNGRDCGETNDSHSSAQYDRLRRQLMGEEVATRGPNPTSGTVVFRTPATGAAATSVEVAEIREATALADLSVREGYMSPTGRVSTSGTLRDDASAAAARERTRAERAGTPYAGVVGHGPDTTWSGLAEAPFWQDMSGRINSSLGRQALNYVKGFAPLRFVFERDLL